MIISNLLKIYSNIWLKIVSDSAWPIKLHFLGWLPSQNNCTKFEYLTCMNKINNRYLSRFFDCWAHETTYAYIGNKHFFTKACQCQTYQNSKISWQKMCSILVIKGFKNWSFQQMSLTKNMPLNWYSSMKKNWERFG